MHAKESRVLEAHHFQVAHGLRVIRATTGRSAEEFRHLVGEALGMASPPSRPQWNHLETGYREISAGAFNAIVAAMGMELEQVLSMALHEMVHGHGHALVISDLERDRRDRLMAMAELIRVNRDQGRQRLVADLGRWDRLMEMARALVALDAATRPQQEESRSADATEHPPTESM